jgi:hypothetical protein
VILRKILWGALLAASAAIAKKGATSVWRVATGEEPPVKR